MSPILQGPLRPVSTGKESGMSQRKRNATGKGKKAGGGRGAGKKRQAGKDGFTDFMDLAQDHEPEREPVADGGAKSADGSRAGKSAAGAEATEVAWRPRHENKTPAWAWGMLPAACTLIVGVGLFSALTFLYGGKPALLWDTSGLTGFHEFYNIGRHPQHVFYVVVVASALLLGMVGFRLAGIIGDLKQRVAAQGELLGRLTSLRVADQEAWQDPIFKMHPEVETFTAELLGAWRHQEARLLRLEGLEGECHRLEKALSSDSREDLAGPFEIPVMAMIAEEVTKLHDARSAVQDDQESWKASLGSKGHSVMKEIQDARSWQRFTQDQLNVQGDAVLKASAHLVSAGGQLEKDPRFAWNPGEVQEILQQVRDSLNAPAATAPAGTTSAPDPGLLDRLSKLSFQIGMEVARLGTRGERLAPMAQTLEELSRSLKEQGGGAQGERGAAASVSALPAELLARLDHQIQGLQEAAARPDRNLPGLVSKLGRTARDAAANLVRIADSFAPQYERLGRVGQVCAEITGVAFDPVGAEGSVDGELGLTPFDPFLNQEPEEDVPVIDPFLERSDSVTMTGGGLDPFSVSNNALPGHENEFAHATAPEADSGLSATGEKVYDLAEFGAVRLPDGDDVHDLDEFGAVPLAAGEDRIYDLNEFGARRLD